MRRRTLVATMATVGTALLAGCSGGNDSSDDGSTGSGTFRLLVSDQPVAIEDFDSLDVTLSSARVFRADEDEDITPGVVNGTAEDNATSSPDDESAGFVEFDLDSVSVDLTQVKGNRAVSVLDGELDEGRYSGIELSVANAEGIVDGETVEVMVPSQKLRIIKPFDMDSDAELDFVFDINVIQKGPSGGYNLLPVIGKSGVAGEDIEVEEVDPEATGTPNGTDSA